MPSLSDVHISPQSRQEDHLSVKCSGMADNRLSEGFTNAFNMQLLVFNSERFMNDRSNVDYSMNRACAS